MAFSVQDLQYINIYFWKTFENSKIRVKKEKERKGELRGNKERFQGLLCCFRFVSFTICQSRNFPSVGSK